MTNCSTFQVIPACLTDLLTEQTLTLHHQNCSVKGCTAFGQQIIPTPSSGEGAITHTGSSLPFHHSVFNNSYSNSVFGQRFLFFSHGALPVPDHDSSSSGKLQAVRYLGKLPELTFPVLNLTATADLFPQELANRALCSRKHKISTLKNLWTVKYVYYYHYLIYST